MGWVTILFQATKIDCENIENKENDDFSKFFVVAKARPGIVFNHAVTIATLFLFSTPNFN